MSCLVFFTIFLLSFPVYFAFGNTIRVDLTHYYPSSNNVYEKYINIEQDVTEISVNNINDGVGFFVLQVHSYIENVTLSSNSTLQPHSFITGTNLGLVYGYDETDAIFYLFRNIKYQEFVSILLVVIVYDANDPVPGGCNLSLPTAVAPYQILSYNDDYITVDSQPPSGYGASCDDDVFLIEKYHLFLDEYDKTQGGYFGGIKKMLTVDSIRKFGRKIPANGGFSIYHSLFSSYRGTGEVFAIIANYRNMNTVSAYVPAVSYGCDVSNWDESCVGPITRYWKFFCAVLLIFGLMVCFYGHLFFKFTLFIMGFTFGIITTYFIVTLDGHFDTDETMITSIIIAFFYGIIWIFIWWKFGVPILSVHLNFILAGSLMASVVFYAGLTDLYVYRNDTVYWITFLCIILLCILMFIPATMYGHIFTCSFLGSYAFIAAMNFYLGGSLQYIVINAFRRATVWHFNEAVISPPFQVIDIVHCVAWAILVLTGLYVQIRDQRGKPPFPSNRNGEVLLGRINERTPLIRTETVAAPLYV